MIPEDISFPELSKAAAPNSHGTPAVGLWPRAHALYTTPYRKHYGLRYTWTKLIMLDEYTAKYLLIPCLSEDESSSGHYIKPLFKCMPATNLTSLLTPSHLSWRI